MKLTNFMLMIDDHYCDALSLHKKIKHTREAMEEFRTESDYRWTIKAFQEYVVSQLSDNGRIPVEVPNSKLYELAVEFEYKMQLYASEGIYGSRSFWNSLTIMEEISDILASYLQ